MPTAIWSRARSGFTTRCTILAQGTTRIEAPIWLGKELRKVGVTAARADAVAALVLLTRHRARPEDAEGRLVCDIDLSILGRSADESIATTGRSVPSTSGFPRRTTAASGQWCCAVSSSGSGSILTPYFRERYEQPARANLRRAIARLEEAAAPG